MISRKHRFHGIGSLRFVYRTGATARGPLFAVKAVSNPRREDWRAAVVVSRKVNKSAVARNRIRRRLYALVQEVDSEIAEPFDIVITVFHDTVIEADTADLRHQITKQLREAGVVKSPRR